MRIVHFFWFKSRWRQNIEGVPVAGGGVRTPSDHCRGTHEQGTEPSNAHIGPCWWLIRPYAAGIGSSPLLATPKGVRSRPTTDQAGFFTVSFGFFTSSLCEVKFWKWNINWMLAVSGITRLSVRHHSFFVKFTPQPAAIPFVVRK